MAIIVKLSFKVIGIRGHRVNLKSRFSLCDGQAIRQRIDNTIIEIGKPVSNTTMRPLIYSTDVIEAMVEAMCGHDVSEYDKDIYREALRSLVRLGQAEQLLTMQLDFNSLTSDLQLQKNHL